jgi:triacylglycerol lipase
LSLGGNLGDLAGFSDGDPINQLPPIILLHGIFGYDRLKLGPITLNYFAGIARAIGDRGHPILTPQVHPTASIARRAQQGRDAILPFLAGLGGRSGRAIIIAHSMGGLDARYMIAHLGLAEHVAALVTIATPHRGSSLADFWVHNSAMKRIGLPLLSQLGLDVDAGADLTTAAMKRFNDQTPDSPHVRYFSISAACPSDRVPLPLQLGYRIVRRKEGDNDSMVSVTSAQWGEHLGTWPVHHLHAINRRFPIDCRCPIGDIAPMYLQILDRLAKG